MKILCVIDSLGSGGAQNQMVELAKGFKEKGHDVSFLLYHDINFFGSRLKEYDIPVNLVLESNFLIRWIKFKKFIGKHKPDAVLSFLKGAVLITELVGLPSRKWALVVGERSADPNIYKSLKLRLLRWFHFLADHVVANSHENMKMVLDVSPFISRDKCHVIYNIVDEEKWKFKNITSKNNGKFNLVVVSSHRYLKNSKGMIEAVNLLSSEERDKLRIDWYGKFGSDGSYVESINLIRKYNLIDVIQFHQPLLDIHEKVELSDAVGLFSHYEGLPNTICEGLVMGKPIIASRISDIPILLSNDERLMFDPNDINDISNVLSNLLSLNLNDLQSIGERNYFRSKELLDKDILVDSYLNLLSRKKLKV